MSFRNHIPGTVLPQSLPALNFETVNLDKSLPFSFLKEKEELVRLSFVFDAGAIHQKKKGVANAFSKLLLSGTGTHSSFEIAENLDRLGAYVDVESQYNELCLQLFCRPVFLSAALDFLSGIFSDIQIPEEELKYYKTKTIENLRVNLEKTSYLSKKAFFKALYGDSLYGSSPGISDIESISTDDLESFQKSFFETGLKAIYSNTPVSLPQIKRLSSFSRETFPSFHAPGIEKSSEKKIQVQKEDAVQASVIIGLDTINRKNEEYAGLNLLSTVLGGYFGSRLMQNIREEKGYTYGISSSIHHLPDRGYFSIRTDAKNEVKEEVVNEIFKEINRLKTDFIPDEELLLVKNYMMGSLQRSFDGSLSLTDRFKTIKDFGLSPDYYQRYMEKIKSADKEKLREIARKYWKEDEFYTVIAGNFD
jgi:zinc protease